MEIVYIFSLGSPGSPEAELPRESQQQEEANASLFPLVSTDFECWQGGPASTNEGGPCLLMDPRKIPTEGGRESVPWLTPAMQPSHALSFRSAQTLHRGLPGMSTKQTH